MFVPGTNSWGVIGAATTKEFFAFAFAKLEGREALRYLSI
jgi:hypothetical protein